MDTLAPKTPPPLRLLESRRRVPVRRPAPAPQAWWQRWLAWPVARGR